eukprot:11680465-Alexandrium_andersonii.AAC.1
MLSERCWADRKDDSPSEAVPAAPSPHLQCISIATLTNVQSTDPILARLRLRSLSRGRTAPNSPHAF